MEGRGMYIYADSSRYEGEFKDNQKNGYGIYTSTTGDKFKGEWVNDLREGKGRQYYA